MRARRSSSGRPLDSGGIVQYLTGFRLIRFPSCGSAETSSISGRHAASPMAARWPCRGPLPAEHLTPALSRVSALRPRRSRSEWRLRRVRCNVARDQRERGRRHASACWSCGASVWSSAKDTIASRQKRERGCEPHVASCAARRTGSEHCSCAAARLRAPWRLGRAAAGQRRARAAPAARPRTAGGLGRARPAARLGQPARPRGADARGHVLGAFSLGAQRARRHAPSPASSRPAPAHAR